LQRKKRISGEGNSERREATIDPVRGEEESIKKIGSIYHGN